MTTMEGFELEGAGYFGWRDEAYPLRIYSIAPDFTIDANITARLAPT